ncbi:phosphopantetheine-binding protein [Ruegeria sp.]|uniref:phosphopantetheine-binding protein n=1 Tax=Ruegeria sp. TaxID=1879320 RepID=UPI0023255C99|nr:phosphopantetheine-binding protein [Ruegeria sp.]MDA7964901.1 phosphopantetheine-binding protein [Ruegeria sp.]
MEKRPTLETIRKDVLSFLDDVPDDHENLLDYGLNSIEFMTLVARWEAKGIRADFNSLARNPTMGAILSVLGDQLAAAGDLIDG